MCIFWLDGVYLEQVVDAAIQVFYILTHILSVLSITRQVLKSPIATVHLSTSPIISIYFCFVYFDAQN